MGTRVKDLKGQVFAELGGGTAPANAPTVQVELSDTQFADALAEAKRWFIARKGYTVFRPLNILDGQNNYQLGPDVVQVLDVIFSVPSDTAAFFTLGFFDVIPFGAQPTGGPVSSLTNYSSFAQIIQFNENRKRVFSVEPEWFFEEQTQMLHVMVRKGANTGIAMAEVKLNTFSSEQLQGKDDWIFSRFVIAHCKEIVGRIRSKYDSLPAAGGTVSLDGKDLIAEAKEEKDNLEKWIFSSQGPDGLVLG